MCGRFSLGGTKEEVEAFIHQIDETLFLPKEIELPRYNVAPGQPILALIHDGQKYRIGSMQWGFVPSYSQDEKIGFQLINAKSETLDIKPTFKTAFENQRCLILADGFYEWNQFNGEKTPMHIVRKDREFFLMAGLWSRKVQPDGSKLFSCAIVTTAANELVSHLHERMPVILDSTQLNTWANPRVSSLNELKTMFRPLDNSILEMYEVSKYVNKSSNEGKQCIEPMTTPTIFQ